jgi:hypothetical protein
MALIRHRKGRCQCVMGRAPFSTCMNPSMGVNAGEYRLCRVHLKQYEAGKPVFVTNNVYDEATKTWNTETISK